jgi:hypothetical protein
MQGNVTRIQKAIARSMGIDPDGIYDPATGKMSPLDPNMVMPAQVFTNQGVPMTSGVYGAPILGSSGIISESEGSVQFNSPSRRSESNNAPAPGRSSDPNPGAGKGGS